MSFDFETLESLCELIVDCPHSTPKWTENGLVVLRNQNIRNGRLDLSAPSFTDETHFKQRTKRAEPQEGDIVITREAPMGEVCMIPSGVKCCLGQRQVLLRPKRGVNGRYLLFALQSPAVQHEISWNEGTGSTVSNIRIPILKSLNIPRHKGKEDEIAKVLWSLSEKIDLNRQINQTLEQIAQAIFKSWFVDFEPVKAKAAVRAAPENQHLSEQALEAAMNRAAMRAISGLTDEQIDELERANATSAESAGAADQRQKDPAQGHKNNTAHTPPATTYQQLAATAALFPSEFEDDAQGSASAAVARMPGAASELGEIPKGWEVCKLSELIEFNPKRTLKKGLLAPYVDMKSLPTQGSQVEMVIGREMGSGMKFIDGDTLFARITPCLENGKTAYVDFLGEGVTGWGSTEYTVMRPRNGLPTSLGYFLARLEVFRNKAIQSMTGTSGRQRANAKALEELPWIKYPELLLQAFDRIAGEALRAAKNNADQNKSLVELRDQLLPKLLSCEISVTSETA